MVIQDGIIMISNLLLLLISKEDLRKRTKISKTVVETLSNHGSLNNMSEKNQLSLF